MFRGRAERKVIAAGYDPERLPPGQYFTEKWPVLHAGTVPRTDLATWDFSVSGEVDQPIRLTWEEFNRLPRTEVTEDIHCVTRWSRFDVTFEGVHWSALKELVGQRPSARFVVAHSEQGYTANVPIASLEDPQALLATHADGAPLTPEHGWPLRLVIPGKYFWKRARSGSAASSSARSTGWASGSATATTTKPTRSRRSDTGSDSESQVGEAARCGRRAIHSPVGQARLIRAHRQGRGLVGETWFPPR